MLFASTARAESKSIKFVDLSLEQQLLIANFDDVLDEKLTRLAWCESRNNSTIRVWDVHSYSFGILQFKTPTFLSNGRRYGILPEALTNREALLLIYNKNVQFAIAREMLRDGQWRAWFNCAKTIGLDDIPHFVYNY